MFLTACNKLFAGLEMLIAVLVERLRPRRAGLAGVRGVTFIEYALLAGIAVVIAALFHSQLYSMFSNILNRVSTGATTTSTNGAG